MKTARPESIIEVPPHAYLSDAGNAARSDLINETLAALITPYEERENWLSSYNVFVNRLLKCNHSNILTLIRDLSLLVASSADPSLRDANRNFVVSHVNSNDFDRLKDVYANREFLSGNMADFSFFLRMLTRLRYRIGERIPTLASHMQISMLYSMFDEGRSSSRFYGKSELCVVVENYADRTDDIIELLSRGVATELIPGVLDTMEFGISKPMRGGAL